MLLTEATGPAVAGIVIAAYGEAACFVLNALSFVAVLVALWRMDVGQLRPSPPAERGGGQIRAGLRYVADTSQQAAPSARGAGSAPSPKWRRIARRRQSAFST